MSWLWSQKGDATSFHTKVGGYIYLCFNSWGQQRHREGQKFLQDPPVSPSFDPLARMTRSGDHFPVEHVTSVTRPVALNMTPSPHYCHHPPVARSLLVFCGATADTLHGFHQKAFQSLSHLGEHLTQEDKSSHVKSTPSSFHFLSKIHPRSVSSPLSGKLRRNNVVQTDRCCPCTWMMPFTLWICRRDAYSLAEAGSTTCFKVNGHFTLGRDTWSSLATDLWPGN